MTMSPVPAAPPVGYWGALRAMPPQALAFVFAAGVVSVSVFGMYLVLLNLYLLRLGYGPEFIGLVQGSGIFAIVALSMPASAAGRRWGLHWLIVGGISAASVALVGLSLADLAPESIRSVWILAFNLAGTSALTLHYVNSSPYQMAISTEADRAYQFSLRWVFVSFGAFAGSVLAGFLPDAFALLPGVQPDSAEAFRFAMLTGAVLLLLAPLAMMAAGRSQVTQASSPRETSGHLPLRLLAATALVMLLSSACMAAGRTFANVYLDSALAVPTPRIGLIVAIGHVMGVPCALLMPRLVKHLGANSTAALGFLGAALMMVPLALVPHWAAAGAALVVLNALGAVVEPVFSMFTLSLVRDSWRPAMAGVTITSASASYAVISLAGGYVIAGPGFAFFFLVAGALSLLGVAIFRLLSVRGSLFKRPI